MRKLFSLLLFFFVIITVSYGQNDHKVIASTRVSDFQNEANGREVSMNKVTYEVEGSPYFIDDYNEARVITTNGNVYSNVQVKVNLLDNTIQFMSTDGKEMVTSSNSIQKIVFGDSTVFNPAVLVKGLPANGKLTEKTFYQLLEGGSMQLLKYYEVSYRDDKPHTTATVTRVFEKKERYFVNVNGTLTSVKKLDDLIVVMAAKKQNEVQAYVEKNKLKVKNEVDLRQIVNYYNALHN